jgi:3-oxoacyl-[acyl-carrier-protein] synthase II
MMETREVWITGIGLISSLGEGVEAHWQALTAPDRKPRLDTARFAPYTVHPLVPVDVARFIPKTSDQRQMERWQRIGVYAAGLALQDAGVLGNAALLDKTDLCIAAGNGDRDLALDAAILDKLAAAPDDPGLLNTSLMTGLRPTLYLGELSNLLAGNIQIVLKATGSSRTFKGEEMAGVAALEDAYRRIAAGSSEIALAGGALNSEREDLLLNMELAGVLHRGPFADVWSRAQTGGGLCLGSVGAFLMVESRAHAEARGAKPYAAIGGVVSDRPGRDDPATAALGMAEALGAGVPSAILSGASGVASPTQEEAAFLDGLTGAGSQTPVCAYGSLLGHGIEAHFPAGAALAAMALSRGAFYPPMSDATRERASQGSCRDILLTGFAQWHGLGLARLVATEGGRQ